MLNKLLYDMIDFKDLVNCILIAVIKNLISNYY